jgi:hypothetical protein
MNDPGRPRNDIDNLRDDHLRDDIDRAVDRARNDLDRPRNDFARAQSDLDRAQSHEGEESRGPNLALLYSLIALALVVAIGLAGLIILPFYRRR